MSSVKTRPDPRIAICAINDDRLRAKAEQAAAGQAVLKQSDAPELFGKIQRDQREMLDGGTAGFPAFMLADRVKKVAFPEGSPRIRDFATRLRGETPFTNRAVWSSAGRATLEGGAYAAAFQFVLSAFRHAKAVRTGQMSRKDAVAAFSKDMVASVGAGVGSAAVASALGVGLGFVGGGLGGAGIFVGAGLAGNSIYRRIRRRLDHVPAKETKEKIDPKAKAPERKGDMVANIIGGFQADFATRDLWALAHRDEIVHRLGDHSSGLGIAANELTAQKLRHRSVLSHSNLPWNDKLSLRERVMEASEKLKGKRHATVGVVNTLVARTARAMGYSMLFQGTVSGLKNYAKVNEGKLTKKQAVRDTAQDTGTTGVAAIAGTLAGAGLGAALLGVTGAAAAGIAGFMMTNIATQGLTSSLNTRRAARTDAKKVGQSPQPEAVDWR